MPKLIIIVVGLVFVFIGYRKTWYPSWALLFNVLISVYTGIMTAPQIVDKFPVIRNYLGDFSYSAGILTIAIVFFIVIQSLAFKFFTAVYVVSFPKILNSAGAAVVGFLAGSVIAGFLFFLINITPLSDFPAVKFLAQGRQSPDQVNSVVLGSCNFVHALSLQPSPTAIDRQMEKILADWRKPVVRTDSAKPSGPAPLKSQPEE
jgi:hypothetical protein